MKIKRLSSWLLVLSMSVALAIHAQAQVFANSAEWKESDVPPPPAFDVKKLVKVDVPASLALVYGVDPASISISKSDSLVRYVMVATSASGATNVMYEALRCSTGEVKTYARYSADGKWSPVSNPQWRSVFDSMPSNHALRFARAGACDAAAPASSVEAIVNSLKNPRR